VGYLSDTAKAGSFDLMAAVQDLAAKGGPGPARQAIDMLRLSLGRRKVRPEEYFTYALWRADRRQAMLPGFLANWRKRAFNDTLRMPTRGLADDVLNDKLATEAVLLARGLPVTRTRAAFLPGQTPAPGDLPGLAILREAGAIAAWLEAEAPLPLFGKPRDDSFARGAAAIVAREGAGTLRLLNGREVPTRGLAQEIAQDWAGGYLFQPFYTCAPDLQRHVGQAMASVRIVTLWTDRGIEPWYGVIRLPARTAMHDGDATGQRLWGLIEMDTGRITRLRDLRDPMLPDPAHAADASSPFLGFALPDWPRAVALCQAGHESFPGHGIIGWDVFLTADGPLLNEANVSPGHVYQVAAQRPLLNPDLRPAYDRALAFARRHGGGSGAF
jgi:hypothetical protein